jgi:hypothetical protein
MKTKNLTIRIPLNLWKKLMLLKINGKIDSIQQIVIAKLKEVIDNA